LDDRLPGLSAEIINDVMELDVHLIQSGLHLLKVFRSLFEQIPPTAEDGSQLTDRLLRPIRGLQQTNAVQIL